jgi:L-amino acid N-acyltransferase YncA
METRMMDKVEPIFKPIRPADYSVVSEIYNYYIRSSSATYHIAPLSTRSVVKHFGLGTEKTRAYLIMDKENTLGFCLIRPYSAKDGYKYTYELTVYLKTGYEGRGIGTQSVVFLEKLAGEMNIHVLLAGICTENKASMRLFEKAGYTECGLFREVGNKFNRYLDTAYFQKILPSPGGKDGETGG